MTPEDMVTIDLEGNILEGRHNPTSEKEIHRQILVKRRDLGACVHSHSAYAIAVCCSKYTEVPAMYEEMSQLIGGSIPVTPVYVSGELHPELGKICADTIGEKNAVLAKHHGPVSCGRTLQEALVCMQVVEKACRVFLALAPQLGPEVIPDDLVASSRYWFVNKYGREKT